MANFVHEDKHRCLLLSLILLAGSAAIVGTVDAQDGAGEAVEIENADDLQELRDNPDGDYVLVDDIDLSGVENFEPIGGVGSPSHVPEDSPLMEGIEVNDTPPFNGTFDGNGHEIAGLTIDCPNRTRVGLFGYIGSDAEIRNVGVVDADLTGYLGVGGLVGEAGLGSTVSDSYVTGELTAKEGGAGGLAGGNTGDIYRSYADVDVNVVDGRAAGGLVGNNGGEINRSYATGDVKAGAGAGGLVGNNIGTVNDSYATGDVTGGTPQQMGVGGLIGTNLGWVFRSYAVGEANSDGNEHPYVGGLVGRNERNEGVTDSYWDIDSTGHTGSENGTGLTTDEMTGENAAENMDGFEFTETWETTESYPRLAWQEESENGGRDAEEEDLPGFNVFTALLSFGTGFGIVSWQQRSVI